MSTSVAHAERWKVQPADGRKTGVEPRGRWLRLLCGCCQSYEGPCGETNISVVDKESFGQWVLLLLALLKAGENVQ